MEQGYEYKESKKKHQKEQKPILDERFAYINKRQLEYASKLKMGKVITYAMRYVGRRLWQKAESSNIQKPKIP